MMLQRGIDFELAEAAGEPVLIIRRLGMIKLAAAVIDGTVPTNAAPLWRGRPERDDLFRGWSGL